MASPTRVIEWESFADFADEFFVLKRSEREWAEQAWEALAKAGLTAAEGELDRHRVAVRFMTLATVHQEFCHLAWQKPCEARLADWAYYLELQPLRVGQLLGAEELREDASSDAKLLEKALAILIGRERLPLHQALCAACGGVSKLFVALWRTGEEPQPGAAGGGRPRQTDDEILNDLTFEKIDAYEFVSQGFSPRKVSRKHTPKKKKTPTIEEQILGL